MLLDCHEGQGLFGVLETVPSIIELIELLMNSFHKDLLGYLIAIFEILSCGVNSGNVLILSKGDLMFNASIAKSTYLIHVASERQ